MKNQVLYRQQSQLHQKVPLFYQPWWLDAVSDNWDIAMYIEDGSISAIFPYGLDRKAGLKLLRNPPLCPYLGPYFFFNESSLSKQWTREEEALEKLWKQIPKWDYCQFSTPPGYHNFLPFHQKGLTNTNRLTYTIDLFQSEEAIFSGFQTRLKHYIRSAEKKLKIRPGMPTDLSPFLEWHQLSFSKKRTPYPFSEELFRQVISEAEQHHASFFQTAVDEQNQPMAILWTPFDHTTAYHLLAATNPACKVNGALALLVWEAIKTFRRQGLSCYDFEGSMDKGIEPFFRKFGGTRVPYLLFEQNNSMIWKLKKRILG